MFALRTFISIYFSISLHLLENRTALAISVCQSASFLNSPPDHLQLFNEVKSFSNVEMLPLLTPGE